MKLLALMPADIARFTLAQCYIINNQDQEAQTLIQEIIANIFYDERNSTVFGINGKVFIHYDDLLNPKGFIENSQEITTRQHSSRREYYLSKIY